MTKALPLSKMPEWGTYPIIEEIQFFKNVLQKNPDELKFLLSHSKIVEVDPGQVVIRKGQIDSTLYFILLGQLLVFFDHATEHPISYMSQGEMFGEVALIRELTRQATVVADPNSRKIYLLCTDFSPFGELDDFAHISLNTKLHFYHSAVDILRQRIGVFRLNYPDYNIAKQPLSITKFDGKNGTFEELKNLHSNAIILAKHLDDWNHQVGNLFLDRATPRNNIIEKITDYFEKI